MYKHGLLLSTMNTLGMALGPILCVECPFCTLYIQLYSTNKCYYFICTVNKSVILNNYMQILFYSPTPRISSCIWIDNTMESTSVCLSVCMRPSCDRVLWFLFVGETIYIYFTILKPLYDHIIVDFCNQRWTRLAWPWDASCAWNVCNMWFIHL